MIFILAFILLVVSFWKKCWHPLTKYLATMQYVAICNLFNLVICHDYLLWELHSRFMSPIAVELFNSLFLLPISTLIYISLFPEGSFRKQIFYIFKWIMGSILIELVFIHFSALHFYHGWGFWVDVVFYCLMYCFIKLHYHHPLITYALSCIVGYILVRIFDVPISF
ncbi:CBO0543 family protein [Bacillus sp. FJAT-49736]|uniref:CBO0543 family protein n=1 Tax=Bacillus sp. FJAT-49736 TaxID=2833582 RepID=UPI001BC915DD|nr:CBO0543 family protein [Bacillus sp. FJAT-49736]MBS4174627.1 hypothetical protein [Bacillus sp. FJAT-49736]